MLSLTPAPVPRLGLWPGPDADPAREEAREAPAPTTRPARPAVATPKRNARKTVVSKPAALAPAVNPAADPDPVMMDALEIVVDENAPPRSDAFVTLLAAALIREDDRMQAREQQGQREPQDIFEQQERGRVAARKSAIEGAKLLASMPKRKLPPLEPYKRTVPGLPIGAVVKPAATP